MSDLPESEERNIREYVELELNDDPVTLVQKVGVRRVGGRSHDIYDVRTKKGRWWVITDLTNLYNQDDFHSADMAFTYHLGVCMVLSERDRIELEEDRHGYAEGAWRRYTQAVDAMNGADEAEDFQAIGIMCREALLALIRENLNAPWLEEVKNAPKEADFKAWLEIHSQKLMANRQRSYLITVGHETWDLTVSLQHNKNATPWDAELVLDATSNVLGTFILGVIMHERGAPERCPNCGSYRVRPDGALLEKEGRAIYRSWRTCAACEWRSEARDE